MRCDPYWNHASVSAPIGSMTKVSASMTGPRVSWFASDTCSVSQWLLQPAALSRSSASHPFEGRRKRQDLVFRNNQFALRATPVCTLFVSVYVLLAIIKKRLISDPSLSERVANPSTTASGTS
jgi:hypothetical protein